MAAKTATHNHVMVVVTARNLSLRAVVLPDERPPGQQPDERDQEETKVAQRLEPAFEDGVGEHEGGNRQDREHHEAAEVEEAPGLAAQPGQHLCPDRNGEHEAHHQAEHHVADQHPVQDPRQEPQHEPQSPPPMRYRCFGRTGTA